MMLATGIRLGPYEVVELVGAGGMGEVYKGRDTRLGRTVALKVLAPALAGDDGWRQRLEREARIVAALSHPHICPVFDVGREKDVQFLVMEYLNGETLQAKLAGGALPLDRALRHAIEIADALAAAHQQGVCHRDLKPGNIMVTISGARLLDFGLAREVAQHGDAPNQNTISAALTDRGIIVGTLQYMAPEQLEGKASDARSDVFAFGCVFYEMITGRKAFAGESPASVIAAILGREPAPLSSLQPLTPASLDRVITKCLAKDPEERWQDVRDLRDELKWIATQPVQSAGGTAIQRRRTPVLPWVTAALLTAALLAIGIVHFRERLPGVSRVAFTVPRPISRQVLFNPPELAPDGSRIIFAGPTSDGRMMLWERTLDSIAPRALPSTENDGSPSPFWSPDGRSFAFFADGKLKTIESSGGSAHVIADAPEGWGGTWSPAGIIVFSPAVGPLFRVSVDRGAATPLLKLDPSRHEVSHAWPHMLPDGRHFIYGVVSGDGSHNGVYMSSIDGEEPRALIPEIEGALYSDGDLLFVRDGTLFAQPFDASRLQLTGPPAAVPGPDGQAIRTAWGVMSASRTGVLSYVTARLRDSQLVWYDRQGHSSGSIGDPAPIGSIGFSPDETHLAVGHHTGRLYVVPVATGIATPVTPPSAYASDPVWSPDGRELVFTSFEGNVGNLYRKTIGRGDAQRVFKSSDSMYAQKWLNNGASLVYMTPSGLYQLELARDAKPRLLYPTGFTGDEYRLSPDERWIAFNEIEAGRWEVFVASFPSFGNKHKISRAGGCQPIWRKDGKELFYLDLRGVLMSVPITPGESLGAGAPTPLFQTPILVDPIRDQYAATGDGRKFIVTAPAGEEEPITVITNWKSALQK